MWAVCLCAAENYDKLLVTDPDQKKLGEKLRERLKLTTKAVSWGGIKGDRAVIGGEGLWVSMPVFADG